MSVLPDLHVWRGVAKLASAHGSVLSHSQKCHPCPQSQVYALDYRADATAFATAGKDYAVRVYDEATKTLTAKLASGWVGAPSAGHSNRIFTLKFVPDDPQLLLSGGWDNTVQIWDLRINPLIDRLFGLLLIHVAYRLPSRFFRGFCL